MSVVARLACQSVLHKVNGYQLAQLDPVLAPGDEHEEEIKQFFAATPGGSVTWNITDEDDQIEPGDHVYLHLARLSDRTDGSQVSVNSVRLDGWATYVELDGADVSVSKHVASIKLTIRNEVAAEQFQAGATMVASFERVPAGA